jgi:hypothetical protein
MNRRGFLGLLAGIASAAVLDPDKLLWVTGRKLISVPCISIPHTELTFLKRGDHFTIASVYSVNPQIRGALQQFVIGPRSVLFSAAVDMCFR